MRLWLFTFTQPDRKLVSARVAAPDRNAAQLDMAEYLINAGGEADHAVAEGTILAAMGDTGAGDEGVISTVLAQ